MVTRDADRAVAGSNTFPHDGHSSSPDHMDQRQDGSLLATVARAAIRSLRRRAPSRFRALPNLDATRDDISLFQADPLDQFSLAGRTEGVAAE